MKASPDHIPAPIFDWLEKYNFDELDPLRQKEVLLYFDKEEYQELHTTIAEIKPVQGEGRKQALLNRFDAKYTRTPLLTRVLQQPVPLWKAAALFLLLGTGWLSFRLLQPADMLLSNAVNRIDTLYLTKEISSPPVKIYDTVYLERKITEKETSGGKTGSTAKVSQDNIQAQQSIPVLSLRELENSPNTPKRNSMKDDSLLKRYSFVSM